MHREQFRILYHEFLFRLMDVELLSQSARGDSNELLGQFGALLISCSTVFFVVAMAVGAGNGRMTPDQHLGSAWSAVRIMISTTMLVVGIFAVLGWDSTFLDRRDVMVLAPLPVRGRTMFAAKVAAVALGLSITIVALNWAPGALLPFVLGAGHGLFGVIRAYVTYWATLVASGAFMYCALLGLQGIAAQLPRRWFLRISSWLQMGSFALMVAVYFLQKSLATPQAFAAAANQKALATLPPYWFLGLFCEASGLYPRHHAIMAPLANRALAAVAITVLVAAVAFLLSYFRSLRKIVEEPEIVPVTRGVAWLPPFGNLRDSALVQFAIRTLLRSRQHRMVVAFYLGIGFAVVALGVQSESQRPGVAPGSAAALLNADLTMLFSSILMLIAWTIGARFSFAIPLDLRANWIFRLTPVPYGPAILRAARRALLALSLAPVVVGAAAILLWNWPWQRAIAHLAVLALAGSILADGFLFGFRKIPYTCSYLPGKSKVHITFWFASLLITLLVAFAAHQERQALYSGRATAVMLLSLAAAAIIMRRVVKLRAREDVDIQWEEFHSDETIVLGLGG